MIRSMLKYKWMCIAVLCCAIFAACEPETIDDTPTNGTQRPITFNNTPARAAVVPNVQNNLLDNARVWGYYTAGSNTTWVWGNNWMYGEKANLTITGEDENLTGALVINGNTKYWMDGTYYFFSLYSEKFVGITDKNEPYYAVTSNKFEVNYDISDQKELRYACHLNTEGSTNRTDKVDFNYQHLLAKVKFQGYSKDANSTITVTKVEISSVPQSATVSLDINSVNENTKSLTATYSPSGTQTGLSSENPVDDDVPDWKCDKDNGRLVFEKMVFPQTVSENLILVTVTYNTNSETGKTKSAYLPAGTWTAGKSYLYKFRIQPSGTIVFANEVIINDWGEADAEIDIQF